MCVLSQVEVYRRWRRSANVDFTGMWRGRVMRFASASCGQLQICTHQLIEDSGEEVRNEGTGFSSSSTGSRQTRRRGFGALASAGKHAEVSCELRHPALRCSG